MKIFREKMVGITVQDEEVTLCEWGGRTPGPGCPYLDTWTSGDYYERNEVSHGRCLLFDQRLNDGCDHKRCQACIDLFELGTPENVKSDNQRKLKEKLAVVKAEESAAKVKTEIAEKKRAELEASLKEEGGE